MPDLTAGRPLPGPMIVEVTAVEWESGKSRRAEIDLIDLDNNPLRLIDYEGAEISIDWQSGHRYRISDCNVNAGKRGIELAPSKRTVIVPLGLPGDDTHLLLVGDTHLGREKHPKTEEAIDPLEAFTAAIHYGINRGVDAVLHAGDVFHDSASVSQVTLARQHVFDPLDEAGIPLYYVKGNHGTLTGYQLLDDLEAVVNLGTEGVTVGDNVRIFGINHCPGGPLPWEEIEFPDSFPEQVSILVLHQTVEQLSGPGIDSVDLTEIQQRFNGEFDLIASGHHHDAIVKDWNGIPVMYTGAAERMSKNKNPTDRVVWLVTVVGESLSYEPYQIP